MIARMYNWNSWTNECRPDILMSKYKTMLTDSGFTIRQSLAEFFDPFGFTAIFLLSESHFAIHTFPEENKTYLELTSCVEPQYKKFLELVAEDNRNGE